MTYTDPKPLEETDPEMALFFQQVANKTHPIVRGIDFSREHTEETMVKLIDGKWRTFSDTMRELTKSIAPNDRCYCGSGKKFKKCCKNKSKS